MLLQPQDITKDKLEAVYRNAGIFHERDSDGDVVVKDTFRAIVEPVNEGKQIRIYALFGTKDGATMEAKVNLAARINDDLVCPRVCVTESGRMVFEHYVSADGGLTSENLVASTRFFMNSLVGAAIKDSHDVLS